MNSNSCQIGLSAVHQPDCCTTQLMVPNPIKKARKSTNEPWQSSPVKWKPFQVTPSWSSLTEGWGFAALSTKQRLATVRILKYETCFELFHTFLFTTCFHVCSFIVLMPSVRIYNVNSHENKEKTLNEKVCPNFWLVVYVYVHWSKI